MINRHNGEAKAHCTNQGEESGEGEAGTNERGEYLDEDDVFGSELSAVRGRRKRRRRRKSGSRDDLRRGAYRRKGERQKSSLLFLCFGVIH